MERGFEKAPSPETNPELELDDGIIEKIIKGEFVEEFDPEESENSPEVNLRYGSKVLRIIFNDEMSEATTVVLKQEGLEHKENETSYLYAAARSIMKNRANKRREDTRYEFMTEDEKMLNWAKTKGKAIFDWDDYIYDATKVSPYHKFVKTFHPEDLKSPDE